MQIDTTTAIAAFYPPLQPPPAAVSDPRPFADPLAATEQAAEPRIAETERTEDQQEDSGGLTEEEQREVEELRARDREVRAHEQAHIAAGGRYVTRAASYEYTVGPDGQQYAVAGEVSIDTSEVPDDPRATIEKGMTVIRAALAPVDPSPQDQRVAAEARAMVAQAQSDLLKQQREDMRVDTDDSTQQQAAAPEIPQNQRLEQRFAEFFVLPSSTGLNLFA